MTIPTLDTDDRASDRRADPATERRRRRAAAFADAASAGWKVWLFKIVALGIVDAMAIYAIF